jgi:hypothetical protein
LFCAGGEGEAATVLRRARAGVLDMDCATDARHRERQCAAAGKSRAGAAAGAALLPCRRST